VGVGRGVGGGWSAKGPGGVGGEQAHRTTQNKWVVGAVQESRQKRRNPTKNKNTDTTSAKYTKKTRNPRH